MIEIAKDGAVTAGGEELAKGRLLAFLKKEAAGAVRDVEDIRDLPAISVVISAHPGCAYRYVQDVMVQCMRAYITNVSWEMGGKRVDASLPRGGVYDVIEPMEVEITREEAEELIKTNQMTREEAQEFLETLRGEERAGERAREAKRRAPPGELRVHIYWANEKRQVIHSPKRALPAEWPGVRVPLSTEGAHVVVSISATPCADLDDLVRKLEKLVFERGHPPVVMDARRAVPFERVFRALEACRAAGAGEIRFQWPPVEGQGGSDWWWM